MHMKYCRKCLQPDTRPNIIFSQDGVCPLCTYAESVKEADWESRFRKLIDIVEPYRSSRICEYDCIVGISGGKDSTRQALWVRDKLGMNPLLVSLSHPPQTVSQIGVDNLSNLYEMGFDIMQLTLSPLTWRDLMRDGFFRFKNWAKSTEMAIFSSVPRIAIQYGIRLVFWGECPLQFGDLAPLSEENPWDANGISKQNTLSTGISWMEEMGYSRVKLLNYIFPTQADFKKAGLQIIYLGWFLGDWSLKRNGLYSCARGLRMRNESPYSTGDLLGVSNLDEDWCNLNQMIKYIKFGFGKVTEYVGELIRSGEISREEAKAIVEKYDGKISNEYINSFCEYLDITSTEFWNAVKSAMNPKLFNFKEPNYFEPKFRVGEDLL
jgi:N-acetyl sugar amidotransferase